MNRIRHTLALLALCTLPLAAQTERPEVVFHVQIVQAGPDARTALAGARERQAADFNRDDQMSIHVLTDQTDAPGLVNAQRGAGSLDIVSLPKMTTTAGLDAHFVIGGRYPVPTADARGGDPAPPDPDAHKTEFGIRLTMRPTPLPNGLLRVRVTPRVQTVDFASSTERNGKFVPALVTRQTSRAVDLKPGQSFAITGVLNNEVIQQLRRIPDLENKRLMKAVLDAETTRSDGQLVLVVTPEIQPAKAD